MQGIYAVKPRFQQLLRPAEAVLIAARIHPDLITLGALALCIAGALAFGFASASGMLWLLWGVPIIALGRTILNALDGMVAKDTGLARPWGEVLNEFCDRLADTALFGGLAFSHLCNGQLITVTLVSVLLSSYLGILAKAAGGSRQFGGVMGKADRMILLAIAAPLACTLSLASVCSTRVVFDSFALIVLGGSLLTIIERARKIYDDFKSNHE